MICCGQGQALSLRHDIEFNLIAGVNNYVFVNYLGGSKPSPYNVVVCFVSFATAFGCFLLTMQLLLFRKNHARLACSVVNALTTAHCHYQLLRIADNRTFSLPCVKGGAERCEAEGLCNLIPRTTARVVHTVQYIF